MRSREGTTTLFDAELTSMVVDCGADGFTLGRDVSVIEETNTGVLRRRDLGRSVAGCHRA